MKAGTGIGTVTSVPAGINCGTDCSEVVNYGTVVTLSAAPSTGRGSVFSGWSGGGCSGTGTLRRDGHRRDPSDRDVHLFTGTRHVQLHRRDCHVVHGARPA